MLLSHLRGVGKGGGEGIADQRLDLSIGLGDPVLAIALVLEL